MARSLSAVLWTLILTLYAAAPLEASQMRMYGDLGQCDRDDIKYIVMTLSRANSKGELLFQALSLTRAGNRVEHVHPLQFLEAIFSDEEMKVAMRPLRRGNLWNDFYDGVHKGFTEESARGNVTPEQIQMFANTLGVNFNKYYALIQQRQWENIVYGLMDDIPRKGDYRRYDM